MEKSIWEKYANNLAVMQFCNEYKTFISHCKTERECVDEFVERAKENGFIDLKEILKNNRTLYPGDKVYVVNMKKQVILFRIGESSIKKGCNILVAHIDSPRLDLKPNPLYEDSGFAMLKTHYYGEIKKYQWVTLPLSIHGIIVKKDGSVIKLNIGESEQDPVIGISDLLVHLSSDQMQKKGGDIIEGEDLNIIIGNIPYIETNRRTVKDNILKIIKEKYDFFEDDLLSAEIEIVPTGNARDYGLDSSMIYGYGQDDRACAYTSFMAFLESKQINQTSVLILTDKEEIGSLGSTSLNSYFFENSLIEVLKLLNEYNELDYRSVLYNSKVLCNDVSPALDPNYLSVNDIYNSAKMGCGLVINKYTGFGGKAGCNEANAEYIAQLRDIWDKNNIYYQNAEIGKVDQGGGGTMSYILARYGMNVIDTGIPILNMHSPWEISCKGDIYEAFLAYKSFLEEVC